LPGLTFLTSSVVNAQAEMTRNRENDMSMTKQRAGEVRGGRKKEEERRKRGKEVVVTTAAAEEEEYIDPMRSWP